MQSVGHADHIVQNALADRLCNFVLNELHIQLQNIQRHLTEHIQGRVSAAEVIHFHDKAQSAKLFHGADDLAGVFRIGALCDLQMQIHGIDAVLLNKSPERIRQVALVHIRPGHIHRYRQKLPALVLPVPELGTHLLPHILIQLGNKSVFLEQRDKFLGKHHAPLRMNPAHQSLGPGNSFIV